MAKSPVVRPKEAIKAIKKAGFFVDHTSGSHYILYSYDQKLRVSIPYHSRPLKRKTLKNILGDAKLSVEDFRKLL